MARKTVQLQGIRKEFGTTCVVNGVDLDIAAGEFVVFVGPSGCGKSTLLRLIAGLETIDAGSIRIGDCEVSDVAAAERGIAMVFQSYALYPHMSVADNMGFGLRIRGLPKADVARRVAEAANILQITPLLQRKPKELSGGQRQRVAIGRAIVREPDVFLFDEPLSNLDASLRGQMRIELARLHAQIAATMIYVTHDQVEAMTLADKIVVLNGGRVEQVGAPLELYRRPANRFVAGFLGAPQMNFLPVTINAVANGRVDVGLASASASAPLSLQRDPALAITAGAATLGIRPEDLGIGSEGTAIAECEVQFVEQLGSEALIYLRSAIAEQPVIVAKSDGSCQVARGARVTLRVDPARCHLFDAADRAIGSPP